MVVPSSSWDSVASRVRRNPRVASREARNRLTALFSSPEWEWDSEAANSQWWNSSRVSRSTTQVSQNSRYALRSNRRSTN